MDEITTVWVKKSEKLHNRRACDMAIQLITRTVKMVTFNDHACDSSNIINTLIMEY